MINRIILNETSYFGRGAINSLPGEVSRKGFKKAFVVTDKALEKAKVCDKLLEVLNKANIAYEVFSDVVPNPTVDNVLSGLDALNKSSADFIIAIGGGSPIDTAKCIGIIKTNPEFSDVVSLAGVANTKNKSMPLIAIPTTSGTAAEVTINYVITDEVRKLKMVCVDPNDIALLAIIDPDLMDSMPKVIAASTGMDALTHALEGYITKSSWCMSDMFHEQAIKMIYENLEAAVNEHDLDAIEKVAYAQYIAGMGFSNVGLGIVHSMAHSLGALYDTPHGTANALLLPHVLKFNGSARPDKFKEIARMLNLFVAGKSEDEIIESVADAILQLAKRIDIPQTLREINVLETDLEKLSAMSIDDVCTGGNPKDVTKDDILNIFKSIY